MVLIVADEVIQLGRSRPQDTLSRFGLTDVWELERIGAWTWAWRSLSGGCWVVLAAEC